MTPIVVLFCKSYRDDVLRAQKLARSVEQFNRDRLPFYMCVPERDLDLFREKCPEPGINWVTDEDIVKSNSRLNLEEIRALPGGLAQQVVKSEFWRLGTSENYLCLDSDCYFIRDFGADSFVSSDGTPYTVMHESRELVHFAEIAGLPKIAQNRDRECADIMGLFGRDGRCWDFGPIPVVWNARVWRDLDQKYLQPHGQTLIDAIRRHPGELRWYGEALLAYKSIPLNPIEPMFRCYHYEEQYYFWKRAGETEEQLARHFLGVCLQSNWDKRLDLEKRFRYSKLRRAVRRMIRGY